MPTKNEIKAAREAALTSGLTPGTLTRFPDGWIQPTPGDVRLVVGLAGLSGSEAGALVGVDGRTIRRWTGGDRGIPYAAWALLVRAAGLGDIWE